MANQILNHAGQSGNTQAEKGQSSLEARQFIIDAYSAAQTNNLTQLWSLKTSEAIGALVSFRTALYRWMAAGRIDDADFVKELEYLADVGLEGWVEELIGVAVAAAVHGGER